MTLADFLRTRIDDIVAEWEGFARTLRASAADLSVEDLRDHVRRLLLDIATDMEAGQSDDEQSAKARGRGERHGLKAVAKEHARNRMQHGFTLPQLLAEYRALRASVLRLWPETLEADVRELTRFHESIDEAIVESAQDFTNELTKYRERFLGILAHDLRNPLTSILASATLLSRSEEASDQVVRIALRIGSAGDRMSRMVNDLLDLTRSQLGPGIPVFRRPTDFGPIVRQAVAEVEAAHVHRAVRFVASGDLHGTWDGDRLAQLVSNLVGNAFQHGAAGRPVDVVVRGAPEEVVLSVHNEGRPIPPDALPTLFEPFVRGQDDGGGPRTSSLGLGLYVAAQVAQAHGGRIRVASNEEDGTTFTLQLPRTERAMPPSGPPPAAPAQPHAGA